jgi:hypothetical protein
VYFATQKRLRGNPKCKKQVDISKFIALTYLHRRPDFIFDVNCMHTAHHLHPSFWLDPITNLSDSWNGVNRRLSSRVTGLGEFWAQSVIGFFVQVIENYRISPSVWATIFHGKFYVLILTKNELGYILGDFFTVSSGHPVSRMVRGPVSRLSHPTIANLFLSSPKTENFCSIRNCSKIF